MKIAVTVGFDGVVGVDNIFIVVVDIFVLVAVAVLEFVGRRGVDHARRGLPMVVAVGQPQKFVSRPERADSLCILHFESVCIGGFGRQCDRPAQTAAHDVERRGAVQQRRVVHEIGRDHRKIGHAQHRGVDTHAVPHHLRVRCRRTAKCHGRKRGPAVLFDEDCRIERQHVGHRQGDVLVQDEGVQLCFLYADLFHRTNSCNTDLTNGHHQRGVVVPPAVAGRFFLCSDCCGEAQTDKQKYWFLHIAYRFNTNKKPPE